MSCIVCCVWLILKYISVIKLINYFYGFTSYRAKTKLRLRYETNQLMLCRERMAVCSEIHTKHRKSLCGQKVQFVNDEHGGTQTYSKHRTSKVSCSSCSFQHEHCWLIYRFLYSHTQKKTSQSSWIYTKEWLVSVIRRWRGSTASLYLWFLFKKSDTLSVDTE